MFTTTNLLATLSRSALAIVVTDSAHKRKNLRAKTVRQLAVSKNTPHILALPLLGLPSILDTKEHHDNIMHPQSHAALPPGCVAMPPEEQRGRLRYLKRTAASSPSHLSLRSPIVPVRQHLMRWPAAHVSRSPWHLEKLGRESLALTHVHRSVSSREPRK